MIHNRLQHEITEQLNQSNQFRIWIRTRTGQMFTSLFLCIICWSTRCVAKSESLLWRNLISRSKHLSKTLFNVRPKTRLLVNQNKRLSHIFVYICRCRRISLFLFASQDGATQRHHLMLCSPLFDDFETTLNVSSTFTDFTKFINANDSTEIRFVRNAIEMKNLLYVYCIDLIYSIVLVYAQAQHSSHFHSA